MFPHGGCGRTVHDGAGLGYYAATVGVYVTMTSSGCVKGNEWLLWADNIKWFLFDTILFIINFTTAYIPEEN